MAAEAPDGATTTMTTMASGEAVAVDGVGVAVTVRQRRRCRGTTRGGSRRSLGSVNNLSWRCQPAGRQCHSLAGATCGTH